MDKNYAIDLPVTDNKFIKLSNTQETSDITQLLLTELALSFPYSTIPVLLSLISIVALALASVDIVYILSWLVAVLAIHCGQWFFYRRLIRQKKINTNRNYALAHVLNAGSNIAYGSSLFLFAGLQAEAQMIHSFLLVGLGIIFITNAKGHSLFILTHILFVLAPIAYAWTPNSTVVPDALNSDTILFIIIIYAFVLIYVSVKNYKTFCSLINVKVELEKTTKKLHLTQKHAESAGVAKTRFLAAASHDLRQPIHSLTLFCSALNMKELDSKVRDIANHITIAVESLGFQLDAILDVSKLDAGIVPVNKNDINLAGMLARIHSDFSPLAEQKNLILHLDCPAQCSVFTDSNLFERMIRNLLSNAIKYTDTGEINIQIVTTEKNIFVNIIDTGIGIAEEEQEHIFEEFHQLHDAERDRRKHLGQFNSKNADRRKGLGLGLAIVRRHAKLLGIELKLNSQPRLGSIFTLKLQKGEQGIEAANSEVENDIHWSDLTVLVVDDEPEIRLGMKTVLEILECRVCVAESSEAAISLALTEKPDIALIDFRLSEYDNGLITIKRLRAIYPELPAIIISGDTDPQQLLQIQESGIELLHKPVLVESLKKAISNAYMPG